VAVVRITLDTNSINLRDRLPAMSTIERWADEGKVRLLGAHRLLIELAGHPARHAPASAAKLARIRDISEPAVVGRSFVGSCYIGGDHIPQPRQLAAVMFPTRRFEDLVENDHDDLMHMLSHIGARADIFVSNDRRAYMVHDQREVLHERWGVVVMTADECVTHLRAVHGWG